MKFNSAQMRRQLGYSFTIFALETLHKQGILVNEEMKRAEKIVADKYRPILRFYF